MPKTKVEVYDKDQLIYPFIESDHVTFSNGMKITEMLDQSISMPKVTHEDSSFKVGVGDQDVSSAIVDSSVAEMTIKGQTYQNILPEPSLRNKMIGKSMQRLNEGYDNIEVVDGVSKSAILKGQTLNNIALTINNTIHKNAGKVVTKPSLYDMTKRYMVMFDVVEKPDTLYMKLEGATGGTWKCDLSSQKLIDSVGRYYLISSVSSVQHKQIKLTNTLSSSERCIVTNVNVIEYQNGMENWDIPYFEGMQSVKMPVLTTVGKNLFDGKLKLAWDTVYAPTNFLQVQENKNYVISEVNGQLKGATMYCFDENKNQVTSLNATSKTIPNGVKYIKWYISINDGVDVSDIKVQIEEGAVATSYEPYKSNILSTPEEVVLRSLPNGVCDTLNVRTGEYVQNIGEVVFDGSDDENWDSYTGLGELTYFRIAVNDMVQIDDTDTTFIFDKIKACRYSYIYNATSIPEEMIGATTLSGGLKSQAIYIYYKNIGDVNTFKTYLQSNPITVQYELAAPTIKTVDLSSSGNWEKIVLDGSETGWNYSYSGWANKVFYLNASYTPNLISHGASSVDVICEDIPATHIGWLCQVKGRTGISAHNYDGYTLQIAIDGIETIEALKQYLSQNPLTVWYQTAIALDSTQVKQPIFFKDGHIQLSSGADSSLIPILDYQAKTSNSYVMDLMKANTRYTMKAKSASGTFTIDGTSYNVNANGIFTTPTSMTNKLLVMNNKTNEEVMILEGDVVSKTIPYFKGIKSAFEDEDKIEVLSTGKNLFNIELVRGAHGYGAIGGKPELSNTYTRVTNKSGNYIIVKPNTKMTFTINNNIYTAIAEIDKDGNRLGDSGWRSEGRITITTKPNTKFIGFNFRKSDDSDITVDEVYQASPSIEESSTQTFYEPYKSNSTKIPLLSPLRSLPNGVKDEVVVNRMKNKVTLIQRVGKVVFDGSEEWYCNWSNDGNCHNGHTNIYDAKKVVGTSFICNKFRESTTTANNPNYESAFMTGRDNWFGIAIHKDKLDTYDAKGMKKWLSQNPTTVLYELNTPIITEIDLEGYPYAYKDGHIFLNSDIAPTTQITYSINQAQQIESANENLQRHEKEISHLQKLIAQYIQVEYESTLLSLKI